VIEGWHEVGGFDGAPVIQTPPASIPSLVDRARKFGDERFRPSMNRLTLLGLLMIKNSAHPNLFSLLLDLLAEVFESSHRLHALRLATPYGARSVKAVDHLSETLPAVETLITLHILGSYLVKRRRFQFLSLLLAFQQPQAIAQACAVYSPGLTVATPSDIMVCMVKSWLSHIIKLRLR
jgi:hypothetical protein